ncbi:MAG TPA: RNA polymerase sigma-70 factor [Aggregatilineales bacterium]|nr:RNA polymerase sigma-70 factor [Aggregatilineales bacterium]
MNRKLPDSDTFESNRRLLFSIAYRMLGSAMEAEDMVQEAYLRYQRSADSSDEPIQFPKAYLTTIITRLCLDQLKSAKTRREEYVGTWLPEPIATDGAPGAALVERETISMAFLVLLESLTPMERAVFLLREVFDYDYAEIAPIVGKSEANCRRYYHRARQFLTERRPRFEPSTDEQNKLLEAFMQVVVAGDVQGLTDLLAEDVAVYGDGGGKVPSAPRPVQGRKAVIKLIMGSIRLITSDMRIEIKEVNGAPSVLYWTNGSLTGVFNFAIAQSHIVAIHSIFNPDKLAYLEQHGGL